MTNRLPYWLGQRGWSDAELGRRAGLSRSRCNRIKNRRAEPTVGEALRMAAALRVPLAVLFPDAAPAAEPAVRRGPCPG